MYLVQLWKIFIVHKNFTTPIIENLRQVKLGWDLPIETKSMLYLFDAMCYCLS